MRFENKVGIVTGSGGGIGQAYAEALDRGQNGEPNLIRFRAERYVSASFDATVHAGIRVTLAV